MGPSNPENPVRYDPDRWDADIEIVDSRITGMEVDGNGRVVVDFYVRFMIDLSVEVPVLEYNNGVLGFPYYGYDYVFTIWKYDPVEREPLGNLLYRNTKFSVFALLLETDPGLERVVGTTSLAPVDTLGEKGTITLRWISEEALGARTVEELERLREQDRKFTAKGVLELVGRDIPLKLSPEDLEAIAEKELEIKFYAGIMLWSTPGGSQPGGTSLIAWSSSTPVIENLGETGRTTTTSIVTETLLSETATSPQHVARGFEENLANRVLVYDMALQYTLHSYTSGGESSEWVNATFKYKVMLGEIDDEGYVHVKGFVDELYLDANNASTEEMLRGQLGQLDYEARTHLSELMNLFSGLLRMYAGFEREQWLKGLNYSIEYTEYASIPAIKVEIHGEGPANISGAEESSYKLDSTVYFDEYTGILLAAESNLWMSARLGEDVAEGVLIFNARLMEGSDALPRVKVKPKVIFYFEDGSRGLLKFTARNAVLSNVDVSGDTLTLTISGDGIGSIILEAPGGTYVREVELDGTPVEYIVIAETSSKTLILVTATLSQHMLSVRFSKSLVNARITDTTVEESPRPTRTVEQPATSMDNQATPTTTTTHTQPETTVQGQSPTGTVNPTSMFGDLWPIILAAIIAAIIGGLVAMLKQRRRRQPYYYPPTPPPPPPPPR